MIMKMSSNNFNLTEIYVILFPQVQAGVYLILL